jgi:hypothetical protein
MQLIIISRKLAYHCKDFWLSANHVKAKQGMKKGD